MKNGYEYYYLFGLDINLEQYGLGIIKQPRLIDYLDCNINMEGFHTPFVLNDIVRGQADDKDIIDKIVESAGCLTFFLMNCYQGNRPDILEELFDYLKLIYNTNDIYMEHPLGSIIVGDVVISNDNFDKLCDVCLEMSKLDKSKMNFDKKEEYDKNVISDKMLEAKRRFLERNKGKNKDKSLGMLDIANILIHFEGIEYEKVMNMTIFQLKNSFELKNKKESFDINTLYRVSPKFDMSKEKYEHWTEKIKLDKSALSQDNG